MGKKVFVDNDGNSVGEGSDKAAFIFNEGDDRLDKFRNARKARAAIAAGKPDPRAGANRSADADDDGSVERVGKK